MPRIKRLPGGPPKPHFPDLVAELVQELRSSRDFGQPTIVEQHFPRTNALRVTVIWDKWAPLSDEDRAATIRQAYEQVESQEFADRIALAIGLTVPEAHESGLLPYQVLSALRKGDPVSLEQCRQAMLAQGASLLFDAVGPQLRFATQEEAEACVKRLDQELPGSAPVWVVTRDVGKIEPILIDR